MYWYQTHESNIVSYIGHKACLDPSAVDLLLFYILCGSKSYRGLFLQLEAKHGAER